MEAREGCRCTVVEKHWLWIEYCKMTFKVSTYVSQYFVTSTVKYLYDLHVSLLLIVHKNVKAVWTHVDFSWIEDRTLKY